MLICFQIISICCQCQYSLPVVLCYNFATSSNILGLPSALPDGLLYSGASARKTGGNSGPEPARRCQKTQDGSAPGDGGSSVVSLSPSLVCPQCPGGGSLSPLSSLPSMPSSLSRLQLVLFCSAVPLPLYACSGNDDDTPPPPLGSPPRFAERAQIAELVIDHPRRGERSGSVAFFAKSISRECAAPVRCGAVRAPGHDPSRRQPMQVYWISILRADNDAPARATSILEASSCP